MNFCDNVDKSTVKQIRRRQTVVTLPDNESYRGLNLCDNVDKSTVKQIRRRQACVTLSLRYPDDKNYFGVIAVTKIIFVCFGNICRSPMAEFVMKNLVARAGREKDFVIESAGTNPSVGTPVSNGTVDQLRKNQVPFEYRTSKQFLETDYARFDYLIGLDRANVRDMTDICRGDPDGKIFLMMDFAGFHRDVADPWYTDDYETTYRDVLIGCEALLEKISAAHR